MSTVKSDAHTEDPDQLGPLRDLVGSQSFLGIGLMPKEGPEGGPLRVAEARVEGPLDG